jgi:hypothetical protein
MKLLRSKARVLDALVFCEGSEKAVKKYGVTSSGIQVSKSRVLEAFVDEIVTGTKRDAVVPLMYESGTVPLKVFLLVSLKHR